MARDLLEGWGCVWVWVWGVGRRLAKNTEWGGRQ